MEEKIIYEVLRVINKKPLFLERHLERMNNSFSLINEKMPFSKEEVAEAIRNLIKKEDKNEGNIKITYEVNSKKFDAFFIKHSYPDMKMYEEGVKTIFYIGERDNPNAKIVNDDFRSKVNEKIKENNAYEAILVDRNGKITEGSRSNIFMVKGNKIITSPVKAVLPGVTRNVIVQIIKDNNMELVEEEFDNAKINELDAIFISGTSPKILPIKLVGNIKFDVKNSIVLKLMKLYDKMVDDYIKNYK